MDNAIPKIIHQIWSGVKEPLPAFFEKLGETWRKNHPDWEYVFWDNNKMNNFMEEYYPQYFSLFQSFKYDIQRWDAIRYLILYQMGGLYADFDYECIMPLDSLLAGSQCCFSQEPSEHALTFEKESYFNNALIASIPRHPFMDRLIKRVFKKDNRSYENKYTEVMQTTGPYMLMEEYALYPQKEDIYLIPAEYVSPFTKFQVSEYMSGHRSPEKLEALEKRLEKAYAVHYFMETWTLPDNGK